MKKERKSKHFNREFYEETFQWDDTRHYGLWKKRNGVKIDPKRFQEATGFAFSDNQLKVINGRHTHYFHPKKDKYNSYYCNLFVDEIMSIKEDWHKFETLISIAKNQIPKPTNTVTPGNYINFQMGISGPLAAQVSANYLNAMQQAKYENEIQDTHISLYAQFLHQAASKIEAITVKVLTRSKSLKDDKFDRRYLYATAVEKRCSVKDLPSFKYHDKLYCIWNFIKHNSETTYDTLHTRYPEALFDNKYTQGSLAMYFVKFSDEMILEILYGCIQFFKEYCELVFNEDYDQAQWNYNQYFLDIVNEKIEEIDNPLGLEWWDDID